MTSLDPVEGQLMGLFEPSHMKYEADRQRDPGEEPSLKDMTALAVKQLSQNKKGYFFWLKPGASITLTTSQTRTEP